jgi:hypothetical protein
MNQRLARVPFRTQPVCSERFAVERREAQGSSQGPARPGIPTTLKPWVPESWRVTANPRTGFVKGASHQASGASRRSIPLGGKRKQGRRAPNVSKQTAAERWLTGMPHL